jgi:hypothetical protein
MHEFNLLLKWFWSFCFLKKSKENHLNQEKMESKKGFDKIPRNIKTIPAYFKKKKFFVEFFQNKNPIFIYLSNCILYRNNFWLKETIRNFKIFRYMKIVKENNFNSFQFKKLIFLL